MKGSGSVAYTCEWCNDVFLGAPSRGKAKRICCSKKCMGNLMKKVSHDRKLPNVKCVICGKDFWRKPSHLERVKQSTCSKECKNSLSKKRMSGMGNHQYGLKGKDNPTWKSDIRISEHGYRLIRDLNHPFRTLSDFVLEHRLIAEKYLLNAENSVEVDGKTYLNPSLEVHHIDEDKLNNSPENLLVLTKSEHMKLHNKGRPIFRDGISGRFVKKEEIAC